MNRQKADSLIRTKLRMPYKRSELVARPRLQEKVAQGLRGPLTLIAAPAGFGKTTLVASCIADCEMPVAWLSLDKNDNQENRLLNYLVAALQTAEPAIGSEAAQMLAAPQQAPSNVILTSLINDLDSLEREMVLVLDDYQFIKSQAVHEQMTFLLEYCPSCTHLVIASRSDPPLPITRLRARGQVLELRTADLRFSQPEAAQFLNEVMGLQLEAEAVTALEERTEGWIAGLQMAALSMRDRKDVHGFIESFSGTHRFILDYLLEEVLASQLPEIQHFLLQTSILDRLTAPLCEAVIGDKGLRIWRIGQESSDNSTLFSPIPPSYSSQVLEYLEQSNLFLVSLDDERRWFRYHHLFADLLRARLQQTQPELIPGLHLRASVWYEQNGWPDQAVEHAFSIGDLDRVGRLVENQAQKLIYQIPFETMQDWIDRLPEEIVLQRTWLGITQGWLWVAKMQTSRLDSLIDKVEEYFLARERDRYSESDQQDILSNIASLRAYDAFFKGDLQRCIELSQQALKLLNPANLDLRVRILVQLGETYLALMDLDQASTYLYQAVEAGIALEDFQSLTTASMRLYKTLRILGRLNEAEGLILRVFQVLSHSGRANSPIATKLEQCWGDLLRERGQVAEAGAQLAQALEHARRYHSALDMVTAQIYQSAWMTSQSELDTAQKALDEAESLIRSFTIPPVVMAMWSLQQARLYLEKGELERAEKYICDPAREESRIVQAKLLLKKGEFEKANRLILQLEQDASAGQRYGNLVQIWLLKATVLHALGNQPMALEALVRCLTLAHPQAYLMTFLDEGESIHELLQLLHIRPLPQPLALYVLRLLQAFEQRKEQILPSIDAVQRQVTTAQELAAQTGELVEPLSSRELEVLHLMAQGRTNLEIARQLIVAPGTVKAHASNIYRKLDAANRTEAVARARQLAILP
jgi:LuxR family maltose regulon positive regulatory protein